MAIERCRGVRGGARRRAAACGGVRRRAAAHVNGASTADAEWLQAPARRVARWDVCQDAHESGTKRARGDLGSHSELNSPSAGDRAAALPSRS
jgi:hypothetical protein